MNKAQRLARVVTTAVNNATINLATFRQTVPTFASNFGCTRAVAQEALWILRDNHLLRDDAGTYVYAKA